MHRVLLPLTLFLATIYSALAAPSCGLVPPSIHVRQGGGSGDHDPSDVLVSAWYPGWLQDYPPEHIPWKKYTAMTFAFAVTTPEASTLQLDELSQTRLPEFVKLAKSNNVKALVSVGGWTGSRYFSPAVSSPANRATFVKTIVDFAKKYDLDGIDFDWEYPGGGGLECNQKSGEDAANFLGFLQALRADPVGRDLIISAAVGIKPFLGPDQQPLKDVSGFAKVFDYISIMVYDLYGPWSSTVGPNAALDDTCATTQAGSALSALKAWTGAGFPAEQISLGIASYGHSFHVVQSSALSANGQLVINAPFDSTPKGDKWDGGPGNDPCGTYIDHPGGIFNFVGLIETGFLKADGSPAAGIDYHFDECSQTPFVYNRNSSIMVSYDNKESLAAKGRFVNMNNMKGVTMWHVAGDSNDILINAVHEAMHIEEDCS